MDERFKGVATTVAFPVVAFLGLCVVLYVGKPLLMPLVLAIMTAIVLLPIVNFLVQWKVPEGLAIFVAQVIGTLPVLVLVYILIQTIGPLSSELPSYQDALQKQFVEVDRKVAALMDRLTLHREEPETSPAEEPEPDPPSETPGGEEEGLAPPPAGKPPGGTPAAGTQAAEKPRGVVGGLGPQLINQGISLARSSLTAVTVIVGYLFLMVLFTTFILLEGRRFREKTVKAFGEDNALLASFEAIGRDVRTYIIAKSLISAATGLCVWIFLENAHVHYASFWGLVAFAFNYIPNIGSIVAAIPPILLAMVDKETWPWYVVAVGILSINTVIGSFLDPRFVGQQLKLSPLVVLLSMLGWGILWGPVGMILAVPIMVSVKIVCSHTPGLEAVATLMEA